MSGTYTTNVLKYYESTGAYLLSFRIRILRSLLSSESKEYLVLIFSYTYCNKPVQHNKIAFMKNSFLLSAGYLRLIHIVVTFLLWSRKG